MKRWLLRITLLLLLGVVTTVAVAWGLSLRAKLYPDYDDCFAVDRNLDREGITPNAPPGWWATQHSDVGALQMTFQYLPPKTTFTTSFEAIPIIEVPRWVGLPHQNIDPYDFRIFHARGFPALALACETFPSGAVSGGIDYDALWPAEPSGGFGASGPMDPDRVLPLRPIVPGFIINTLSYAAIWFVLIFTLGNFKRWNRRRRGLCPMCKYNLRGNPEGITGCAECGWGRGKEQRPRCE